MNLNGSILTLHNEDFECSSNGRHKVIEDIKRQMREWDINYITVIYLPQVYLPHFIATDLYKNLIPLILSEVEISSWEYGF